LGSLVTLELNDEDRPTAHEKGGKKREQKNALLLPSEGAFKTDRVPGVHMQKL
jgi:hypothetical protein